MSSIKGTDRNDKLKGDNKADTIQGLTGDDKLEGFGGNDTLKGGNGDDKLFGGSGDDKLVGGDGQDHLYGESGNDLLEGGDGKDYYYLESSTDGDFARIRDSDGKFEIKFANSLPGVDPSQLVTGTQIDGEIAPDIVSPDLIFDNLTGKLYVDPDGASGPLELRHIATIRSDIAIRQIQISVIDLSSLGQTIKLSQLQPSELQALPTKQINASILRGFQPQSQVSQFSDLTSFNSNNTFLINTPI